MLPNEKFALECRARYEAMGLVVDERNGEFAHCPYPRGMGESGYYLLHDDHQHQGLLQSKDVGRMCFFTPHAKRWLLQCDFIPADYFELWDIYEEFSSKHSAKNGKINGKKVHEEKDENGKSKQAVKMGKIGGKISAKKAHEEKDENGKSKLAVKGGKIGGKKVHEEKDENGKSLVGIKWGKASSSQIWESTIDGFQSNAGCVAYHNKANGWDPAARIRIK